MGAAGMESEGLSCSRPCPDLGCLALHQRPGQKVGLRPGCINRKFPTGARRSPEEPWLTRTKVERINTPYPKPLLCSRSQFF